MSDLFWAYVFTTRELSILLLGPGMECCRKIRVVPSSASFSGQFALRIASGYQRRCCRGLRLGLGGNPAGRVEAGGSGLLPFYLCVVVLVFLWWGLSLRLLGELRLRSGIVSEYPERVVRWTPFHVPIG